MQCTQITVSWKVSDGHTNFYSIKLNCLHLVPSLLFRRRRRRRHRHHRRRRCRQMQVAGKIQSHNFQCLVLRSRGVMRRIAFVCFFQFRIFSNYFSSFVDGLGFVFVWCFYFLFARICRENNNFHYVAQNTAWMVCMWQLSSFFVNSVHWIRTTRKKTSPPNIETEERVTHRASMLCVGDFFLSHSASLSLGLFVQRAYDCEWKACVCSPVDCGWWHGDIL